MVIIPSCLFSSHSDSKYINSLPKTNKQQLIVYSDLLGTRNASMKKTCWSVLNLAEFKGESSQYSVNARELYTQT